VTAETLKRGLKNPSVRYAAVRDKDVLMGYYGATDNVDFVELTTLAVKRPYRRLGLARLLLDDLRAYAAGRGLREIFLEVSESNTAALRLYGEYGFAAVGVRAGYYRDGSDAAVMKLSV
jgi:ribosomal-protein-alanine acetyltransferase